MALHKWWTQSALSRGDIEIAEHFFDWARLRIFGPICQNAAQGNQFAYAVAHEIVRSQRRQEAAFRRWSLAVRSTMPLRPTGVLARGKRIDLSKAADQASRAEVRGLRVPESHS